MKYVGCRFWRKDFGDQPTMAGKVYTYKTRENLEVGDVTIAIAPGGEPKALTVVQVEGLPPLNPKITYRYCFGRILREDAAEEGYDPCL